MREVQVVPEGSALAYWHGDYLAVERDENIARLAEVSVPTPRVCKKG